jgi:L-fuculose-phosphate aldolase
LPAAILRTMQAVGRDLYALALVTSHGGNLSLRDGLGFWITGTGTMLGHLEERHISLVHPGGDHEGPPPSSDTVLHSAVYLLGDHGAVVHAHPRHATALSFSLDSFVPGDFEGAHHLVEVPVIAQGPQHAEQIAQALQTRKVALLRGHGAYARGGSAWEALHWLTALEESAQIHVVRGALER